MGHRINHRVALALVAALVLLALGSGTPSASAAVGSTASYAVTELGALLGDATFLPAAINNSGQVAGTSGAHAVLWDAGSGTRDLGNPPGGLSSSAAALDDQGDVVGTTYLGGSAQSQYHAFLWQPGAGMRDIGTLGGYFARATGVNDKGQVVGRSTTPATPASGSRAFLWRDGSSMVGLEGLPGGTDSGAAAINAGGQVVGDASTAQSPAHAFLWDAASGMHDLGTLPGDFSSRATAINDTGQVVGYSSASGYPDHPVLWLGGGSQVTLIPAAGSPFHTLPTGINDKGQVVGSVYATGGDGQPPDRAFLYRDGKLLYITDLIAGDSGWELRSAAGINNRGQIVGLGVHDGKFRGYLLTPLSAAPPSTTATLSPPPNAAGWNRTSVTVTLAATGEGGAADVDHVTYSATGAQLLPSTTITSNTTAVTISAEGVTTLAYFATGRAGHQEQPKSLSLRIDKTAPTVTYGQNRGTYTVDQDVAITCTATDPPASDGAMGSGVASTTCSNVAGAAYTFPLGANTLSATATDNAGNVGTGSATFTVRVTYDSLCALSRRLVTSHALAGGMCVVLRAGQLNEQLGMASGKTSEIGAYQQLVQAAQRSGFVRADQAAVLMRLAGAL